MEFLFYGEHGISIRAPAKGATLQTRWIYGVQKFQSALPRRERQFLIVMHLQSHKFQSALPRRERLLPCFPCMISKGFQSALPRRERRERCKADIRAVYFNPRSREGSDTFQITITNKGSNFNPRSREGSDFLHSFINI